MRCRNNLSQTFIKMPASSHICCLLRVPAARILGIRCPSFSSRYFTCIRIDLPSRMVSIRIRNWTKLCCKIYNRSPNPTKCPADSTPDATAYGDCRGRDNDAGTSSAEIARTGYEDGPGERTTHSSLSRPTMSIGIKEIYYFFLTTAPPPNF